MATLGDEVFDNGLVYLQTNGTRIDLCSQEPATYLEATDTYSLGNETGVTISAPSDRVGGGRKVTVPAVSGGSVTGTGTATHYAITNPASSELLVTGLLASSQPVTSGNTFDLTTFDVGIPDPA